jgi:putative intracellular protease/amidase
MTSSRLVFALQLALALCAWLLSLHAHAADIAGERDAVVRVLNDYIEGSGHSDPLRLQRAFHPDAVLLLSRPDRPYWSVGAQEYIGWFSGDKVGRPTGRIGNLLSIDIEGDTASAKVEILMPAQKARFVDLFLLRKLEGAWKIVAKTATRETSVRTGERVLLIVSSATRHGTSVLPAGTSFGEVVDAWDAFRAEGYTVDIVTPEGGPAPIDVAYAGEFRSRLYDADLMHALQHTHAPAQIDPAQYRAVYFVGGSNAIYGVPENTDIQRIAMHVYERNGGVISAVCHGTAGLAHLKLRDGRFLVQGKRVSGYPEEFEKQDAAYFREFPFPIRRTIESRGGTFQTGARNQAFVVVDGRVVTGQNHLSSRQVVEAVVHVLRQAPSP